jgi:hypothetical protein
MKPKQAEQDTMMNIRDRRIKNLIKKNATACTYGEDVYSSVIHTETAAHCHDKVT